MKLCKMNGNDASQEPAWYQDMDVVWAFDIVMIDCVVGWIKVGDWWGIIDWSYGEQCTVMHDLWEPEYKSEDNNS